MTREVTRKETIKIMEHLKSIVSSEDYKEALSMAIEALQEPEIVHCNDCKLHNSCSAEDVFNFFRLENGFCAVG